MTMKILHSKPALLFWAVTSIFSAAPSQGESHSPPLSYKTTSTPQLFYVGSWTGARQAPNLEVPDYPSQGIYLVRLNSDGTMKPLSITPSESPSWLTLNHARTRLYAVNEVSDGKVFAYQVAKNGNLTLLNQQASGGEHPTHANLSPDGRYLLVANYAGGAGRAGIAALPIDQTGRLGRIKQYFAFSQGSGKVAARQSSGHAHSVTFSPTGEWLLAADLGADMLRVYRYQPERETPFIHYPEGDIKFQPGAGPRHSRFSADGKYLYITSEMSATISVYRFSQGKASLLQELPLTQSISSDKKSGSALLLSPDQRFLYVGNRGTSNVIIVFPRDLKTGKLGEANVYRAGGIEPREFAIDSSGRYLLVSNVYSNNVVQFARDIKTGALHPTGITLQIGTPTQVLFSSK